MRQSACPARWCSTSRKRTSPSAISSATWWSQRYVPDPNEEGYCALRKLGELVEETHSPWGEFERGGGPPPRAYRRGGGGGGGGWGGAGKRSRIVRFLVLSSVFPNAKEPDLGVFVRERVRRVARHCHLVVVAPVPWFPGNRLIRGPLYAGVPRCEEEDAVRVYHPRFLC